jgi:hypothetical protein
VTASAAAADSKENKDMAQQRLGIIMNGSNTKMRGPTVAARPAPGHAVPLA